MKSFLTFKNSAGRLAALGFTAASLMQLGATPVFADATVSNQAVPTSTSEQSSIMGALEKHLDLRYWGVYDGGSLSDPLNAGQPNPDGSIDRSNPQMVESYITSGYKINPELMVGVINHFFYFPNGSAGAIGTGQDIQLLDPALTIQKKNLVQIGGFSIKGILSANLPVTAADRLLKDHDLFSISPTASMNYDFPNSKLSLGVYTYLTAYIPAGNNLATARNYKFYVAPNANYQMTRTVALTAWVDLIQSTRLRGSDGFISGMTNPAMDIEPGVNWDITKNISFNPFLNIFPKTPTLTATAIQAVLTAKAF